MEILIVGDLHYQINNYVQTNMFHQELIKIIKDKNISKIIFLGDMMHRFEKIDLDPLNRIQKLLEDIHNLDVEIFVCIGNHDISSGDHVTNKHAFNSFKYWTKTNIIDFPQIFEEGNIKFCCLPYIPDGKVKEYLNLYNIDILSIDVFFCHSDFKHTSINNLSQTNADIWDVNYPLMIGGHLHDYEEVQKNLIYVGTPYQHSFSDKTNKGIFLATFNSENNEKVDFTLQKIILNIPQKIYLTINYEELFSIQIPEGEVKIKIVGPIKEVKKLLSSPDLREKFCKVKIVYYDTTNDTTIYVKNQENMKSRISFSERILQEINNDIEMKFHFNSLFSI
jgi:DNA repair exonuclease SbcCD nuclease subunit